MWIAQCLEYDITAHARDPIALREAFNVAIMQELCINLEEGRLGLDGIPKAPERFEALYRKSQFQLKLVRRRAPKRTLTSPSRVEVREFRFAEHAA